MTAPSARPATPRRFATRSASWRRPSSRWPTAPAKPPSRAAARAVQHGQQVIGESLAGLHGLVSEVQGNAVAIERLADETVTIGKVLTVIRAIAEQTNLLALNAAIEAARAGGHGRLRGGRGRSALTGTAYQRGHRGNPAADRPSAAGRAAVRGGDAQSGRACRKHGQPGAKRRSALEQIVSTIASINHMAEQIAQATRQQGEAVGEIRGHSERIHQLGDANLGHISRGREQSAEMLQLGSELDRATQAFRF